MPQLPNIPSFILIQNQKPIKNAQLNRNAKTAQKQNNNQQKQDQYLELLGVRPSQLSEFIDGDPSAIALILETVFVDDTGGFLAALRNNKMGAEVVGRGLEVGK